MGSKSGKYTIENGSSTRSRTKILSSFSSNGHESIPTIVHQNTLSQNVNNLTLIWLDTEINNRSSNIDTQIKLKNLINSLRIFDEIDEFEKYIKQIGKTNKDKLLVIISTTLALTIIPHLHDRPQVKYIYIHGKTKLDTKVGQQLLEKYPKVSKQKII
jgi:hypothetical protein